MSVLIIIDGLLDHKITKDEAISMLEPKLVEGKGKVIKASTSAEYFHGADCNEDGIVTVYHFCVCEDAQGKECELYTYLVNSKEDIIKKGYEYSVTKSKTGEFKFEGKKLAKKDLKAISTESTSK